MRIDLHCHSEASHDCVTPLSAIPARCAERGIRIQAITDHNKMWGAQDLQAKVTDSTLANRLTVIVGIAALHGPAAEVSGDWTHPGAAFAYKAWTFLRAGRRALGSGSP